jgi:hypothetical protein
MSKSWFWWLDAQAEERRSRVVHMIAMGEAWRQRPRASRRSWIDRMLGT